jgi:peptidoglycan/xylan/chitin deacetylase (PgdA/CDA1 family)
VKALVATSPGWALSGLARREGLVVVMYHRVGPNSQGFASLDASVFRDQMVWLKENCTSIRPEDLLVPEAPRRHGRPLVLVTFDDGYRDYHDHAYPILKELGIHSIVFLSTIFMDEPQRLLWPDILHLASVRARPRRVRLPWGEAEEIDLATPAGRKRAVRAAKDHVKELPNDEKNRAIDRLLDSLEVDHASLAGERTMLSWDEVRRTMDITTYGGHTHTHPILSRIGSEEAEVEIRTGRERIAAETGQSPRHFAYPNGRARDFTPDTKAILRRQGFEVAYTTVEGINRPGTDKLELKRVPAAEDVRGFSWALMRVAARR